MSLEVKHQQLIKVREEITTGLLPELEFGLLKRHGEKLRWKTADKEVLLGMNMDILRAKAGNMEFEIVLRTLCHSDSVTADYLQMNERFNMKQCVLVLGDVGVTPAPWAQLVQIAVHLFQNEFNLIWIEIPMFSTNSHRWMKYGPEIIKASLSFLGVRSVCGIACGVGGSVFLQTIVLYPALFGKTHFIFNMDLPSGSKSMPFPMPKLEELLRQREMQLWFAFQDEPEVYDRFGDGTPSKAYDAVTKMATRLEGERRRGERELFYDEVLITEKLNLPRDERVRRVPIGKDNLFVFSDDALESITRFLNVRPGAYQTDLPLGLVVDYRQTRGSVNGQSLELPALWRLRAGPSQQQRSKVAEKNRKRQNKVFAALTVLKSQSSPALLDANSESGSPKALNDDIPASRKRTTSRGSLGT